MSEDQAVRSINRLFVNRVLVARGGEPRYGSATRPAGEKTFDLSLAAAGEESGAAPEQASKNPLFVQQPPALPSNQPDNGNIAAKIYQGSLGIFRQFSEQHPELHGSELLSAFLSELRVILAKGSGGGELEGISAAELEAAAQSVDSIISQIRPMLTGQSSSEGGSDSKLDIFV